MTTTTLYGQAAQTVDGNGAGNGGTIGLHFTVSAACSLDGIWLYSPSGQSLTQLPTSIALYNYSTQALITSNTASWSGAAGSGWVFAAFTSPPSLASGTGYMAAAFRNDTVNAWFALDSTYTWPKSNGILTAPKDTGNGQGWFYNTTTTALHFPSTQLAGYNWYLDVQVSTSAGGTLPAPGQLTAAAVPPLASRAVPLAASAGAAAGPRAAAAIPAAAVTAQARPVSPPGAGGGALLTEGGGSLLTEAGGALRSEGGAGAAIPAAATSGTAYPLSPAGLVAASQFTGAANSPVPAASVLAAAGTGAALAPRAAAALPPAVAGQSAHPPLAAPVVPVATTAAVALPPGAAAVIPPGAAAAAAYELTPETGTLLPVAGASAAAAVPATPVTAPAALVSAAAAAPSPAARILAAGTSAAARPPATPASVSAAGATAAANAPIASVHLASAGVTAAASPLSSLPVIPAAAATGAAYPLTASTPAISGALLTEAGGHLLTEAGDRLLDEAGSGSNVAIPVASAAGAAYPLGQPSPVLGGRLLTEAGSALLTEAGGYLLDEGGSGGTSLPVATAFADAYPLSPPPPPPPVPFPRRPLDLDCELLLGTTWTSTRQWLYQRAGDSPPVTITRGRPDETTQANPAAANWEWNNRDGRFSPKNPLSPYYGLLGRNTAVRFSVPAEETYLRLENDAADRAYVNDSPALRITGSMEIRMALRLSDWRGCVLAARYDASQPSWYWVLNDDATMTFGWWDASALSHVVTSTSPVPYSSGSMVLVVYLDASSSTVTFWAGPGTHADDYVGVELLSTTTLGPATTMRAGNAPLVIGWSATAGLVSSVQMLGRVHEFKLYAVPAGTAVPVADAVFAAVPPGAGSWQDAQGNLWQLAGGAGVSSRNYRFHGEMSSQPPKWDVTGRDMAVAAQAGGPLRRLGQGNANAMSAMKRAVLSQADALSTVAYWTMEDAAGATSLGASIGPYAMTFGQDPAPQLSSDSTFLASAPLPTVNGAPFTARVSPHHGSTAWATRFLCKVGTLPGSGGWTLAKVAATGECTSLFVNVWANGDLQLVGYRSDGTTAFDTGQQPWLGGSISGQALWWSVEATEVTGGVKYSLVTVAPGASTGYVWSFTLSTSAVIGNVTAVQLNPYSFFTDTVFGHLSHQTVASSIFDLAQPLNAWDGETAAARYARLATENGYQVRILGAPAYSAAMGPQGVDTLGNLLQECETADLGLQFEPRQQLALGYRTLASTLNQVPAVTVDYAASHPGGASGAGDGDSGLEPTYDDALLRNDWTLTRGSSTGTQGATWQAQLDDGSPTSIGEPPDGVGDYANSQTVNVQYDSQLPDVAGWMVHTGSIDEARWPSIPFNLARAEILSDGLYYPLLDAECGDYLQLTTMPEQVTYDPVKQLALGMSEALGGFHHELAFNAAPESACEVAVLDDPVLGRCDTDGSQLHQAVSSTATSLQVASTGPSGIPWTTDPADFPLDINIAGERITVIGVSGTSGLQTFTVIRAVNGVSKAQLAGADVRLWTAPILALA